MSRIVVCLGGTGQLILHFYAQLYLIGKVQSAFKAVVIDTDEILPSIVRLQRFFESLRYAKEGSTGIDGQPVPEIVTIPVRPKGGEKTYTLLTGRAPQDSSPEQHPCHAFFNRDTLFQDLRKGLFARPVLSSTLSADALDPNPLIPEHDSTVVVVGSVLGGTGGGLLARVIDQIESDKRRHNLSGVRVRAVFFGEYFRPDPDRIEGGTPRFQSNQRLVLRAIGESLDNLHSFHIIGGPGNTRLVDRNPDVEKRTEHLDWPEGEDSPYWRGPSALNHLLSETARDFKPEFSDREMLEIETIALRESQESLTMAITSADALIRRRCIARMAREPFLGRVWGEKLPNLLGRHHQIAQQVQRGESISPTRFAAMVQRHLNEEFSTGGYSLSAVFPHVSRKRLASRHIANLNWPSPRSEPHMRRFETTDACAAKAASAILFHALRSA